MFMKYRYNYNYNYSTSTINVVQVQTHILLIKSHIAQIHDKYKDFNIDADFYWKEFCGRY